MGETFGLRVYQARLALQAILGREVTQAEVGKAVGVTGQAVGLWETGKSEPKLDVIIRLAKVLQSEPAWLAFGIRTIKGAPEKAPPGGNSHSAPIIGETANPSPSAEATQRDSHNSYYETLRDRTERRKKEEKKGRRRGA